MSEQQPTRDEQLYHLRTAPFDLLVIGGGATGAGIALDAQTRGLEVALVEASDFSSGTSSRSTKLIHGGVRYLESAVRHLDRGQLTLVREALRERATLLKIAPHLSRPLPLVTPVYSWWRVPYYWLGLKIYDWLSGKRGLGSSVFLSPSETIRRFPHVRAKGLKGSVLYWDGQFDDARMNVSLILTAIRAGAVAVNHVEVTALIKEDGKVRGATVHDRLTGRSFDVSAEVVINATGPFADSIRGMDDPSAPAMIRPSAGSHVLLPADLAPSDAGLLIPETRDGRVLFMLPWQGATLAGTTDVPCEVTSDPRPTGDEIDFILSELSKRLDRTLTRDDVRASWSGLRPLVQGNADKSTADLSRDHVVVCSNSGLITVVGGKWTTYRKMAQDAVDLVLTRVRFGPVKRCQTPLIRLVGAVDDVDAVAAALPVDADVGQHLAHAYGSAAKDVVAGADERGLSRIHSGHPYIWAEVAYAVGREYACTVEDVLARRLRLAFLDQQAVDEVIPAVAEAMGKMLHWSAERRDDEVEGARRRLISAPAGSRQNPSKSLG